MRHLPPSFDLGTTSARAVRLVQDQAGFSLHNYVELPMPRDAFATDGSLQNPAAVTSVIQEALRLLGLRPRWGGIACVAAMPVAFSAVKSFTVPTTIRSQKRAARNAELRASEFAKDPPLDKIDECSIIVQRAGEEFIIFKTLRAELIARELVFRKAGCNVVMDHEALALQRALPLAHAIIDIGRKRTLLIARSASGVPFCRTFAFGGEAIAERLSRGATVDRDQAEQRLRTEGFGSDESADWLAQHFVADVERALNDLAHNENVVIQRVVLTGNGSRIPGLLERIARKTLITDVKLANLANLANLRSTIPPRVLEDLGPSLTLAVGLAMWDGAAAASWEADVASGDYTVAASA